MICSFLILRGDLFLENRYIHQFIKEELEALKKYKEDMLLHYDTHCMLYGKEHIDSILKNVETEYEKLMNLRWKSLHKHDDDYKRRG